MMPDSLFKVQQEVTACARCPRLVQYREQVAQTKRRAYRDWEYWGRAVPGFGDPKARLLVIGLAPAAHGGNRTGRVFTGDSSGDLLYRVLYETGFANQPASTSRNDGMKLKGAYITATVRCAPPDNKPLPEESRNCREYLERELELLRDVRVVVALGKIAFDAYLAILQRKELIVSRSAYRFAHGATYRFESLHEDSRLGTSGDKAPHHLAPGTARLKPCPDEEAPASPGRLRHPLPALIASYHPSRQNTQTGRLTKGMFLAVFRKARNFIK
jgi:uracil-DNA glycosylase family 4